MRGGRDCFGVVDLLAPLFLALVTNRIIQAVVRFKRVKLEVWSMGMTVGVDTCVCSDTSLISISRSFGGRGSLLGQSAGEFFNYDGPFHHSECSRSSEGNSPLEAQSAGLSNPFTCHHLSGGSRSTIVEILFPT